MVETRENWREIIQRAEDAGSDALELNFGCPHGMCERGMGSAVGQEPKVLEEITRWAVEDAKTPVIIKLTPNTGDINEPGEAAARGGAHALSLINTVKSIVGVDLDLMVPNPRVGAASTNGGYCGPAVKPLALFMLSQIAKNPMTRGLPLCAQTHMCAARHQTLDLTGVLCVLQQVVNHLSELLLVPHDGWASGIKVCDDHSTVHLIGRFVGIQDHQIGNQIIELHGL
jgi:dihydropyrimidine dehydrogenase (NAD+) subunit PreA